MKRLSSSIAASALGLIVTLAAMSTALAAPSPQVVTITASTSALFTPNTITVHVGQPVELKIIGQSGVHGVQSNELGIPNTMVLPGQTKTVTFTPSKAGTFTLNCSVPCGPSHGDMKVTIKVV